jgi:hypothetical protein
VLDAETVTGRQIAGIELALQELEYGVRHDSRSILNPVPRAGKTDTRE